MVSSLLLVCMLRAASVPSVEEPPRSPPDMAAYQAAKAQAGRDADAQVKLALWCEAHGLSAERIKHLTLATLLDPSNAAARGLLGLVAYQGKWQSSRRGRQAGRRGSGAQEALQGIPGTPGQDARPGRGPLEARPLVRAERAQAAGRRPPPPRGRRSTRGATRRGSGWASRSRTGSGSSPTPPRPRRPSSRPRLGPTSSWKPRLEKWRDALVRPRQGQAGRRGGSPRPGARPPRRAHGLDGLRPGRRVPPANRREAPRPDRRPGCLTRAGADGGLQPLGRASARSARKSSAAATRATSPGS